MQDAEGLAQRAHELSPLSKTHLWGVLLPTTPGVDVVAPSTPFPTWASGDDLIFEPLGQPVILLACVPCAAYST